MNYKGLSQDSRLQTSFGHGSSAWNTSGCYLILSDSSVVSVRFHPSIRRLMEEIRLLDIDHVPTVHQLVYLTGHIGPMVM